MSATVPEPTPTDGAARPEAGRADGQPSGTDGAERRESEKLLGELLGSAADGVRHLRTLASLASERARLRVRRTRWAIVQMLVVALAGGVLAVNGALYLARGLAGTLAELLGNRPRLGELAAGILLLGLVSAGVALAMGQEERRELARLRRKYGDDEKRDDGRGAAGAGALSSAGGAEARRGERGG